MPVGPGERPMGVRGERQLGVAQRGQGGTKEKFAQRRAIADHAFLHECFEAEGVGVGSNGKGGVGELKQGGEPVGRRGIHHETIQ